MLIDIFSRSKVCLFFFLIADLYIIAKERCDETLQYLTTTFCVENGYTKKADTGL